MRSRFPLVAACLICLTALPARAFEEISLSRSKRPSAMGLSPSGVSYVIDTQTAAIIMVGADRVVKRSSLCEGVLRNPQAIACCDRGIAVLDGDVLWYLDETGRPLKRLSLERAGIQNPQAFCLDRLGYVYVTDADSSSVYKLDPDGRVVSWVGRWGVESGTFITPVDVAVDSRRNYYVADWDLARVQKFDPMGRFIMSVGEAGDGPGLFRKISAVAVQGDGGLLVADYFRREVQAFFPDGRYRGSFEEVGLPSDIALRDGSLHVLDTESNSIRCYDLGELTPATGAGTLNDDAVSTTINAVEKSPADDGDEQPPDSGGAVAAAAPVETGGKPPLKEAEQTVPEVSAQPEGKAGSPAKREEPAAKDSGTAFDSDSVTVGYRLAKAEKRKTYEVDIRGVELLPGGGRSVELTLDPLPTTRLLPGHFRVYEGRLLCSVMTVEASRKGIFKVGFSGGDDAGIPETLTVIVSGGHRIGKGTWNRSPDKE